MGDRIATGGGFANTAGDKTGTMTTEWGAPVGDKDHSLVATPSGGLLLQDTVTLNKLSRFNRERIPERVVHARGTGAYGYFEAYGDESALTRAAFLSKPGERVPLFCRFSLVTLSKSVAETTRDVRGFAVKMKTSEGIWDMVFNNLPVFFVRDQRHFVDVIHAFKPDPVTNLQDFDRVFDLMGALGGEATHILTYLFSDHGIPADYQHMDGNSVHAYKFINAEGKVTYVKLRWRAVAGVKNLTEEEAHALQADDLNHATRSLYNDIKEGKFPEWELQVQEMKPEQLDDFEFHPLDSTKHWPEDQFPYRSVGKMVLNEIPSNFFEHTEQVAFSPGNMLPGAIEASEDRLLQSRLISYFSAHEYRVGTNHYKLPVNRPVNADGGTHNYSADGQMNMGENQGTLNYEPSLVHKTYSDEPKARFHAQPLPKGTYVQEEIKKTLNFKQAGDLYRSFSEEMRANLVSNLAAKLADSQSDLIKNTMSAHFYKADKDYGQRVAEAIGADTYEMEMIAAKLKE
ncbi:hypothetical protein MMPV_008843 [Pyropia vietnamensis]